MAIASRCGSQDGKATLKTRKGLDWTDEIRGDRRAAGQSCRTAIIDGEIVALDENGAPDFAALQAALSEGKTDDLVFFAFDLLFDGRRRSARHAAVRAQGSA